MTTTPHCSACEVHAESTFTVEGMDCREEVALIERRFRSLPGLEEFNADVIARRLHVRYDASKLSTAAITAAVADAGMRAWLEHEEPVGGTDPQASRRRWIRLAGAAAAFAGGALLEPGAPSWVPPLLYSLTVLLGLPDPARKARQALRLRVLDINVLMMAAAAGAIALGQWSEAAAVVFMFAVAQALEARTLENARYAVRALIDLAPSQITVRDERGERAVAVGSVEPGALVVIRPGGKIPLDGEVVHGTSAVNQSPVTGESLPIDKGPGDAVFAGTINGRGALEVRVTRRQRDSTLARIVHLVEQAQAQRAPAQAFVERFARVYTPAVLGLSLGVAAVPPLLGADLETWVYRGLVLLVVSCPCALVISTPVSVVAALAGAARRGVLIKGGVHLERASRIRCVAFDKTGTLTRGTPAVVAVTPMGVDARDLLGAAAAVERRSEHPIAQAIVAFAAAQDSDGPAARDVSSLPGRGAEGTVDGARVIVGNHRLFEERGLCTPSLNDGVAQAAAAGRTPVLVARGGTPIGLIAVADEARPVARGTLDLLRRQGVERIVMLSGDSAPVARALADALGVDEWRAELMPEEKVAAIDDLRARYGTVAMVGDGVNDAPALASADVGIAMGAAGSDAALETADVALMADELPRIPYALRLSRATLRNIKANLAISLVLKAAFVVAAVSGVATLWMAVLADTGASILVIANALRLLRAD
ncbi:MAG: heavy metal translocating P-type ATPase [Vicinamibacterales bacterium]